MTTGKHFVHDAEQLVAAALKAIPLTNPSLRLDERHKIIYRAVPKESSANVSIVSGGGSGHEPSFTGLVGEGLLTAAVAGTIFASPSAEQVRQAITRRVGCENGVLVIVMNYTGDVLNFGMAVEKAKAAGINIDMVIVGDDVGVGRKQGGKVGRRGIAGTVIVHKIAGALAATGANLKDVARVARSVAENLVSIGSSLAHVHVPGHGEMEEELGDGEVEIGMGIHNEPGCERTKVDFKDLINHMLAYMLDQSNDDRAFLQLEADDSFVLLVNNLGGMSNIELGAVVSETVSQLLVDYRIVPERVLAGAFMTSLNGNGFSLSLLRLHDTDIKGQTMLRLLDAPTQAIGWANTIPAFFWEGQEAEVEQEVDHEEADAGSGLQSTLIIDEGRTRAVLTRALQSLIEEEPSITHYDTVVGDGDCGTGLKRGAEAVLNCLDTPIDDDALHLMSRVCKAVESSMDGTSGALFAIFLNALTLGLRRQDTGEARHLGVAEWADALNLAMQTLGKYTAARPGDRTIVDALQPFVETLSRSHSIQEACEAAVQGARKTQGMKAGLGRTVYVGGDGYKNVPDPGAYGLATFLAALSSALEER